MYDTRIYARPPGNTEGRRRKVVIGISKLRMVQSVVHLSAKLKAAAQIAAVAVNPLMRIRDSER